MSAEEHLKCCTAELFKLGASITEIEHRLTDTSGSPEDRIRWALLHIEAIRTGKANPLAAPPPTSARAVRCSHGGDPAKCTVGYDEHLT